MIRTNEHRVFGLDLFRAIAILIVVYIHGRSFSNDLLENFPSIPLIDGVELFFVLSGFLIGSILIKTINLEGGLKLSGVFHFWKRRWFRTLPNYYLFLMINILLVYLNWIPGDLEQFGVKFLFFLQNFYTYFVDFFWESWSLCIEEWFYIILPLFLLAFIHFLPVKKAILVSILLLIILPLIYRISISNETLDSFWWDVKFRKVVLTRLDAIMFGVLAAFIKFYFFDFWQKYRNVLFFLGITIITIVLFSPRDANFFYTKTYYFTLISLGVALLLPKADLLSTINSEWIKRSVTFISKISYSMYLVNLPLLLLLERNFPPNSKKETLLMYLIYWTFTVIISTIVYKFFEKPIMNLRDKF